MGKKVLYLTDFPAGGSGYSTISKIICSGLVDQGYDVKMVALQNRGEEHWHNFSVIPVDTVMGGVAAIHNLTILWKPDVLIVALDIIMHQQIYNQIKSSGIKYIAITPLENGPLLQNWATTLMQLDDVFFISELGKQEALKVGVTKAKHLKVGLIPDIWRPAEPGEREIVRTNLGFAEDETIILTVADNHERKNLWAGMRIVEEWKKLRPGKKCKYVLVTREHNTMGYDLMGLACDCNIQKEIIIFERGMPEAQLRLLYISADVFLLPSKAEGLGLPVIEALMCGTKCVTTDTGALTDLLKDGVGWLVEGYNLGNLRGYIDIWGNSLRTLINIEIGAEMLQEALLSKYTNLYTPYTQDVMVNQIRDSIEEVTNG